LSRHHQRIFGLLDDRLALSYCEHLAIEAWIGPVIGCMGTGEGRPAAVSVALGGLGRLETDNLLGADSTPWPLEPLLTVSQPEPLPEQPSCSSTSPTIRTRPPGPQPGCECEVTEITAGSLRKYRGQWWFIDFEY
jgi:hypothetical protein